MKPGILCGVAAISFAAVAIPPAHASLIGTSVSGQFLIGNSPPNSFDPAFGDVPSGYGNSSPNGPNNVIIGSGIEFGYNDGANIDTADFTDNGLTVADDNLLPGANEPFTMIFTDAAFNGASVSLSGNTFPVTVTESLVGDVLTVTVPEVANPAITTYDATFSITPAVTTPEPGSLALLASFGAGLAAFRRRREK